MDKSLSIQQIKISIYKEFWEFRKSIVGVPLAVGAIFLAVFIFEMFTLNQYQQTRMVSSIEQINAEGMQASVTQMSLASVFGTFLIISFFIQAYYALSCLYDERRDKSVFFWRSMPVSDGQTIGVKLLMAALLIPAVSIMIASILSIVAMLVMSIIGLISSNFNVSDIWSLFVGGHTLSSFLSAGYGLILYALWLFPLIAWLMLASAYAKKSPFLIAVIPLVLLSITEVLLSLVFSYQTWEIATKIATYLSITPDSRDVFMVLDSHRASSIMPINFFIEVLHHRISLFALLIGSAFIFASYWVRKNSVR
jgi:ABC-2 type transport system permease protein